MSDWKLIEPSGIINYVEEPSFEVPFVSWSTGGINTIAQSTIEQTREVYSCLATFQNSTAILIYTGMVLPAAGVYTVSMKIFVPSSWDGTDPLFIDALNFIGSSYVVIQEWDTITFDEWITLETRLTVVGGDLTGDFRILAFPAGPTAGRFLYVDEVQCSDEMATYCDGEQPGCAWNGAKHLSTSYRSVSSRSGGIVRDLQADLDFDIGSVMGAGMPSLDINFDDYTLLPGGEINGVQEAIRRWQLGGIVENTTEETWHASRQELVKLLSPFTVPKQDGLPQPVIFRYTGSAITKEIAAHYERGLESSIKAKDPCYWERLVLTFKSPDPYWYDINDSSQILDSTDTPTLRYITGRLKSTSQWDDLGLTANPTTNGDVKAILVASDGIVYVGGNFTGMDAQAGRDYIASYNPLTDTWSTVGGASDFNDQVFAIVEGPDGTIYAGGNFLNCAGVPAADGLAQWDGTNWTAVGAGSVNAVYALVFGLDGILYIGGLFANFGGVGNADNLAQWDGAAYAAVGGVAGPDGQATSLAIRPSGYLVMAGAFNNVGGVPALGAAQWDGAAFSQIGNETSASTDAIVVSRDNTVYLGGGFTQDGDGNPLMYIAQLSGSETQWSQLGSGMNLNVEDLVIGPDDILYASGRFTEAGGITVVDKVAKWNGSSWSHLDIDFPGAARVLSIAVGPSDPLIERNYDIWAGFNTTGAGAIAGITTVTNNGTARAFPLFVISRSGGTEAIIKTLRNKSTGLELLLDYSLLDGETLTLNLKIKSMESNFFGSRPDAVLANSDWGEWALLPEDSEVTCFVDTDATVVAYLLWRDPYESYD